jgi:hypothetical protein
VQEKTITTKSQVMLETEFLLLGGVKVREGSSGAPPLRFLIRISSYWAMSINWLSEDPKRERCGS